MLKIRRKDLNYNNCPIKNFFYKYSYMFWCLGIGDFLTLDSFIPDFFYTNIKKIFLFTSRNEAFKKLIKANKNYSKIEIIFSDNQYDKGEIYKIDNYLKNFCTNNQVSLDECFQDDLLIWKTPSVEGIKPKISSFFTEKLCQINYSFLNKNLCVICPTTTNTRGRRFFTNEDWIETIKILKYYKLQGVILGNELSDAPKIDNIIDMTGKTNILEALEIAKKAKYYIGIDSFLSTLAMQTFPEENIYIKSTENHLFENAKFFSPFKKNINFVSNCIKGRNLKIKSFF